MLESLFRLSEHRTTWRTEVLAGATTFLTMAYIIFVNPAILSEAGMDRGAVFVATCLAAAIGAAVMGLYANYPIALAPGMGLNAYFAYGVVLGMGHPWPVALGAVFISGLVFVVVSVLPIREWLINGIPMSLKIAISAGIGLFLAVIGLKNAGLVVAHPVTLLTVGDLTRPEPLLASAGFVLMAALSARRVPGALILSILAVTGAGVLLGITQPQGLVSMPPSLAPTFFKMDIAGAFDAGLVLIIFAFFFVDLFDTAGTLIGLAHRGGMLDRQGRLPRLRRALLADSVAIVSGAALGTSSTTAYIESASGINAGGRTGLTAIVVAALFLLALFLAPLAATVPAYATAPALLFVACLMAQGLAEVQWNDITESAPAVIVAVGMPFTFSIATGIGLGFISYAAIKILSGRAREASPAVLTLAAAFAFKFSVL